MAQILSYISIGAFVVAVIALILSIVIFIRFDIKNVYNDLTGKTAKRTIEQIRENNIKSGDKSYKPSKVNIQRGKLTETIGLSNIKEKNKETTKKFGKSPDVAESPDESTILKNIGTDLISENKGLLKREATTARLIDEDATALLIDDNVTMFPNETQRQHTDIQIELLEEVILVNTQEVIV